MRAKVKRWIDGKGFGFIQNPEGGRDIFVHRANVKGDDRDLKEGEYVNFEVRETEKGLSAVNVTRN